MRIRLFIGILLFLTAFTDVSQALKMDSCGPILTYGNRKRTFVRLVFYTHKEERSYVTIKTRYQKFNLQDLNKRNFHSFKIKTKDMKYFSYTIHANDKAVNGISGDIVLPDTSMFRFAVLGNTRGNFDTFQKAAKQISWYTPTFVINTGNLIMDSMNPKEWSGFFQAGGQMFRNSCFMPTVGTKDFYSEVWRRLFDVSNDRYPFYSYVFENGYVIVLNTSMYLGKDSIQYQWLLKELKRSKKMWTVVVFHNPAFYSTPDQSTDQTQLVNRLVIPLMEENKVDIVINGAVPYYEHSVKNGIHYFSSAGIGSTANDQVYDNPYRKKLVTGENHFLLGEISKNSISIRAYSKDNKLLDEIKLSK